MRAAARWETATCTFDGRTVGVGSAGELSIQGEVTFDHEGVQYRQRNAVRRIDDSIPTRRPPHPMLPSHP